jgi:DNA modification methylase
MILHDDCIEAMKKLEPNSIDAVVTDPPYGLEFMGKKWDKLWNTEMGDLSHAFNTGRSSGRRGWSDYGKRPIYRAGLQAQLWHTQWLAEAYRVMKPGASMLVMGGTRTFHRLMVAIEDTGFVIKDVIMWIYGNGFPKAQDLGRIIDKRNGRNEELRKQLAKYLREAIKKKGIILKSIRIQLNHKMKGGGLIPHWITENSQPTVPTKKDWLKLKEILSLDSKWDWFIEREEAEREKIGTDRTFGNSWFSEKHEFDITIPSTDLAKRWNGWKIGGIKPAYEPIIWAIKPPEGSFIDSVLKWGVGAVNVDECRVGYDSPADKQAQAEKNPHTIHADNEIYGDYSMCKEPWQQPKGRFPANIILDPESAKILDEQSGECKQGGRCIESKGGNNTLWYRQERKELRPKDSGSGASRFFYCAKASQGERNAGLSEMEEKAAYDHGSIKKSAGRHGQNTPRHNNHPTVKPIALFEYLIKLVTRKGQVILDPFLGSGTTAIAAHETGRECIGVEREKEYTEIAEKRIDHWKAQPQQMDLEWP